MSASATLADENAIRDIVQKLIQEAPKLHDWGYGLSSGGLEGDILATLGSYLIDEFGVGKFHSIETGSGLSTLVFVAARPASHIAINPDQLLRGRVVFEANRRGSDLGTTKYFIEHSELILPELAKTETVDVALIDGGHGWPTVFVDFCYLNMMLRRGGILIVDDIQLFPCMQLHVLLKAQPGWQLEKIVYQKTAFFRKEDDARMMPDFGGQPYLLNNIAC